MLVHVRWDYRGHVLFRLPLSFRDDADVMFSACRRVREKLTYASTRLLDDETFAIRQCYVNGLSLEYFSRRLRRTVSVVRAALQQDSAAFRRATSALRSDRALVLEAIENSGADVLRWTSNIALRDDYEIVRASIECEPHSIMYASVRLREESRLVLLAVQNAPTMAAFIGPNAAVNPELMLQVLRASRGRAYFSFHPSMQSHAALKHVFKEAYASNVKAPVRIHRPPQSVVNTLIRGARPPTSDSES